VNRPPVAGAEIFRHCFEFVFFHAHGSEVLLHDVFISLYHPHCKIFFVAFQGAIFYNKTMTRKNLSTRIEGDLQKEIKKLAIDLEKPLNDLLEEAIRDFLKKYGKQKKG
jgi:hypothetical protein